MSDTKGRKPEMKTLESVSVMGFELLNDDKVARALDRLGEGASEEALLAEYDKLGGGIKYNGRKVAMGSFYDFIEKKPKMDVKYDELEYDEEFVLVRKPAETKASKGLSVKDRIARVKSKKLGVKAPAKVVKEKE